MYKIRYAYEKDFDSSKDAMRVATGFHEKLKGNDDYVESRILLNVEDRTVLLVEYEDSNTHLRVDEDVLVFETDSV